MNIARSHRTKGGTPTLRISGLTVEFGRGGTRTRVVDQVEIDVWPGEIVGIIGESGSGKSISAMSVFRLLPRGARIVSGDIELGGQSLLALSGEDMRKVRGRRIAYIPQDAERSLNPTMRVGRQVGEPLELHRGLSVRAALRAAVNLLGAVHIREAATRALNHPHEFSGGMQQRAMIAMGLALRPELLIADEPTSALDVTVQAQVLDLLREIRATTGSSILFITHDLGVVAQLCDWVYVMEKGRVVESGAVRQVFSAPVTPYTRMLLAALPRLKVAP